jgi:hypothetical protein
MKSCPACKKQVGPRTKKCECGHTFISTEGVPASGQSMTLDPLDKRIAESVGAAKDIIARVENRPTATPKSAVIPTIPSDARRTTIHEQPMRHYGGGCISTPAGAPPCIPKGYKEGGWPDGPATDEVVTEWAYKVTDMGGGRYAPEAVVYWAWYFWDINGQEFRRVRDLIVRALRPPQASHDSAEDDMA